MARPRRHARVYHSGVLPLVSWLLVAATAQAPQTPAYREHVDVTRVLVDARVVDGRWRPIPDLGPADFVVRIDGRAARIESAEWVAGTRDEGEGEGVSEFRASGPQGPSAEGRLIVFVFQKDLESSRIAGLIRMLKESRSFLDAFTPHVAFGNQRFQPI